MLHTATTTVAIVAIPADGHGSISGFRMTCPVCGDSWTTSLASIAPIEARSHVNFWLARQAQALRAEGRTAYSIATELGVSKDWLRAYAGFAR